VKKGGNKRKNFVEGWVEFKDKRIAKKVAAALNGNIIGLYFFVFLLFF